MRILLTRHAETKENVEGVVQGQNLNLDRGFLTEAGLKQISKLIQRLRKEKIDLIISSDSPRCKKTAEEINKEKKCHIEYMKEIREKHDGDWTGKTKAEIDWDSLGRDFETRKAPNGESLKEVRERGRKFFRELLDAYKDTDKAILIISHAVFLRVLIGDLIGLNLYDSIFKIFIENCSLSEMDINKEYKEGYRLKLLNETEFLH